MKTMADIKRRIRPGTIIVCVENARRPELNGQQRRVADVQGNAFTWRPIDAPTANRSWTHYPPAKAVTIVDADTFTMPLTDAWGKVLPETITLHFAA